MSSGKPEYRGTPEDFAAGALALAAAGVRLIGGCCGVGPRHIKVFATALEAQTASV